MLHYRRYEYVNGVTVFEQMASVCFWFSALMFGLILFLDHTGQLVQLLDWFKLHEVVAAATPFFILLGHYVFVLIKSEIWYRLRAFWKD
jgi:hypothetical protein